MRGRCADLPVEPLAQTPRHEPERTATDINWGNTLPVTPPNAGIGPPATVFELRARTPGTWALTLIGTGPFDVTYGSGGAFRVSVGVAAGTYVLHGSYVRVDCTPTVAETVAAFISPGYGAPNIP